MNIAVLADMPSGSQYMTFLANFGPIVLLVIVFYFLLIRPQKKRDKAEKEMRNSIQVGDEISTIGGIAGKVVSIKDDTIVIESTSDRTKLKFYRWAIRGKENAEAAKTSVSAGKKEDQAEDSNQEDNK